MGVETNGANILNTIKMITKIKFEKSIVGAITLHIWVNGKLHPMFTKEFEMPNAKASVTFYEEGLASFGVQNKNSWWSASPTGINSCFSYLPNKYRLAKSVVTVTLYDSYNHPTEFGGYGITLEALENIVQDHFDDVKELTGEDPLFYLGDQGLDWTVLYDADQFIGCQVLRKMWKQSRFVRVRQADGSIGFIPTKLLSKYCMQRYGCWSLSKYIGKILK